MAQIKVVVQGVLGKMGQQVLSLTCEERSLRPIGGIDLNAQADTITLPDNSGTIPLSTSLETLVPDADVVVDFTGAEGALSSIKTAPPRNVNVVIGSTGNTDSTLMEAENLANKYQVGILIAPNFALGAVVMMHLVKQAAPYFNYADLIESHGEAKIDAPSGTAVAIAEAATQGKGSNFNAPQAQKEIVAGTRGGVSGGVSIHSVRMPGCVAHHELVFGALGQTLRIRHDSVSRESFMPGVLMAIQYVIANPGLVVGLDKIMGL